jgi:hypothetical protein
VMGIFKIESHELFAQGWLWTVILLISASWAARITGVNRRARLLPLLIRAPVPSQGPPPSWPHLNLTTSQRPHLLI